MARGDSLQTPLLRVSRPVAACSRCRSAKIKCDGKLPACTACERSKKADSCSGANDEFAKGKERSYVASLEAQSERLERRLAELQHSRKGSVIMRNYNDNYQPGLGETEASDPQLMPGLPRGSNKKEASDIDDLVGDFGFLSLNATARDFHGFTSTMSFARLLLAASCTSDLPTVETITLPPRHVTTGLIQHYLDNIFVLMPFFSETALFASVEAVYEDAGRAAKSSDHWTLRMVLAIAAASQSRQRGDLSNQIALRHVSAALERVESVLHPGSVAGIQAMLLLVQYSMFDPEHFKAWYLLGTASRVMVDLGIHQDVSVAPHLDKAQLDQRRRVFNGVFNLDRYISMAQERAFSFTNDSADVAPPSTSKPLKSDLPWKDQLFLRSLEPAIHLYDIRHIQSSFYQNLSQNGRTPSPDATSYVWDTCQKISDWKENLPSALPQPVMVLFELEFFYAYIMLLSRSCKVPIVSDDNWAIIFELCIEYIERSTGIMENPTDHAFFNYFEVLRVRNLGKRFLQALDFNYDQILSDPTLQSGLPDYPGLSFVKSKNRQYNHNRAINCITGITTLLEHGRQRWNQVRLCDEFKDESSTMLARLRADTSQFFTQDIDRRGDHATQPVYGRRSQGDVGLTSFISQNDNIDPMNPRRARPGYSGFSSF